MKKHFSTRLMVAASALLFAAAAARADIVITEIDPTGSSSSYGQDWFELTNTGAVTQDITGWAMDDNSHTFSLAVPLRGVTSIAAGQSVVFIEDGATSTNDATVDAAFSTFWFGSSTPPAGVVIANYGGSGVGLGSGGDEVNIYNVSGTEITGVAFGAATMGVSFDNAAGIGSSSQPDPVISTLSVVGTNGAFSSIGTDAGVNEIGSPGAIAAVPEPASLGLLALGAVGLLARRKPR